MSVRLVVPVYGVTKAQDDGTSSIHIPTPALWVSSETVRRVTAPG